MLFILFIRTKKNKDVRRYSNVSHVNVKRQIVLYRTEHIRTIPCSTFSPEECKSCFCLGTVTQAHLLPFVASWTRSTLTKAPFWSLSLSNLAEWSLIICKHSSPCQAPLKSRGFSYFAPNHLILSFAVYILGKELKYCWILLHSQSKDPCDCSMHGSNDRNEQIGSKTSPVVRAVRLPQRTNFLLASPCKTWEHTAQTI